MHGHRQEILAAALATLREDGYPGFTQPRIAARAAVRQSHLTYYFPTRLKLLEAVARVTIDDQLSMLDEQMAHRCARDVANGLATVAGHRANIRVILAIVQAADQEPSIRKLVREYASEVAIRAGKLLSALNIAPTTDHVTLLHALTTGIAMVGLALGAEDGERQAAVLIENMLGLLSSDVQGNGEKPTRVKKAGR